MGAITGYIGLTGLLLVIIVMIVSIYYKRKYPEMERKREEDMEIYKKHPLYKFLRISRYVMIACAVFLGVFIAVVVLFNITF